MTPGGTRVREAEAYARARAEQQETFDRLQAARRVVTGEELYTAHRKAWNQAANKRGHSAGLKRWKNLKPWMKKVWEQTADELNNAQ